MEVCVCPLRFFGEVERIYLCHPGCANWKVSRKIEKDVEKIRDDKGELAARQAEQELVTQKNLSLINCNPIRPDMLNVQVVEIDID